MRRLVDKGKQDLLVRETAVNVLHRAGIAPKDMAGEVSALFRYVRDHIRYVRDPAGVELVYDPANLLRIGAGDCDDKVVLLAALLESVGYQTEFETLATRPGPFHHVIVRVKVGGRSVPLDPTVERAPPGWIHPRVIRRRRYGESATPLDLSGYDSRETDRVAQAATPYIVEGFARGALAEALSQGQISLTDVQISRHFLNREGKFVLPAWQRRMMLRLAGEAERVLLQRPGLDAGRGGLSGVQGAENLGGFFGSLWKGVKSAVGAVTKVATTVPRAAVAAVTKGPKAAWETVKDSIKTAGQIAQVIGPALVVIPGIGPVAAAAVTTAGELIAPGQTIPPDAYLISELPPGEQVPIAADFPLTVYQSQNAVAQSALSPTGGGVTQASATVTPVVAAHTKAVQAGFPAGVPWWVFAGGAAAVLLLFVRR